MFFTIGHARVVFKVIRILLRTYNNSTENEFFSDNKSHIAMKTETIPHKQILLQYCYSHRSDTKIKFGSYHNILISMRTANVHTPHLVHFALYTVFSSSVACSRKPEVRNISYIRLSAFRFNRLNRDN